VLVKGSPESLVAEGKVLEPGEKVPEPREWVCAVRRLRKQTVDRRVTFGNALWKEAVNS
jgi:hypothetical protein